MTLQLKKSGNYTYLYALKSFRKEDGKCTTKVVEKFGTVEELREKLNGEDPIEWARARVAEMTAIEKEENKRVVVEYDPKAYIQKGEQRSYNGGYLFLQKIYYELGLDYICKKIAKKHKLLKYDLNGILSMLIYTRILYPGSKRSSLEDARKFFEQPECSLEQVYRALSLLAEEFNEIQADVYKRSLKLGKRNTQVVYYDLTNYFFEWEEEGGLVQFGHCKEGRPLPIVQMGLFMDHDGFPLAMCIEPGNKAETSTLKPMEQILKDKFGLSKLVVCTDGGLSSYENRKNDSVGDRSFITVQSLKKLKEYLQEWALDCRGWRTAGSDKEYDISTLDPAEYYETLFYKERWDPTKMSTGETLEQRIIVTFSFKYREYLAYVRERQVNRAVALLQKGQGATSKRKSPNDAKRFIKAEHCTTDGELAQIESYSLNQEMIDQESRFDGFYALCTDLEDPAPAIIRLNGGRWIIENGFRIMKTDFDARPVYVRRDDRIKAHFLTCFLALLIYKYLEKKVNRAGKHFTTEEIVDTLRSMDFLSIAGEGYVPTYTRTDLTNHLHGSAGFRTDTQIVTRQKMRSIIAQTKKREKDEDDDK
ncbi:IS1634 family transposase [Bacteroides xylanisolvens]|uniref:IS1634 family transposase n=1 Tax=Bacteroides xylanisolvens TaxID=371601 RepID=UPI0023072CEF|nr:IS1634 family transposase [Bacteroides xylanisolvens]MDB0695145.1 IS1634 family transposase [Bacteroides xylanisolvens]MDB0709417.1 IS1634 family transposase [Bacteroides xylanisolvens]